MAVSKILIDGVGIDLTSDTVASANDIAQGKVGHLNDGTVVTGTHSGGGTTEEAEEKDINFYDYDGFRVESWTLAELATKTELPTAPDHSSDITWGGHTISLTFEMWNWTLADLQECNHGIINVGALYKTTDDALHLCVDMGLRLDPWVSVGVNGTAYIDWGDGTTPDTLTGTSTSTAIDTQHTYSATGKYDIKISVADGSTLSILQYILITTSGDNGYVSRLFWRNNTTSKGANQKYARYVNAVYLPNNSNITFNQGIFVSFGNMKKMNSPNRHIFSSIFNISTSNIEYFAVPSVVNYLGNYQPANVKTISIPPITGINGNTFRDCSSLKRIPYLYNATSINGYVFYPNYICERLTIPSSVSSIGTYSFSNFNSLVELKFLRTTPATINNSNVLKGLPTDCKILVPRGTLEAYTSATNYPSSATYTYEEYDP